MEEQSPGLGCMGSAFKYKKFKNKEKNENFSKNINFWGKMKIFGEWLFLKKIPNFNHFVYNIPRFLLQLIRVRQVFLRIK